MSIKSGFLRAASPKKNRAPQGRPKESLRRSLANEEELADCGPLGGGHGGRLAGLEHRAMGLEVRGSAGVIGHAGGDADQDHGDRCNKRYNHDLQVGRAISGNERMVHGSIPGPVSWSRRRDVWFMRATQILGSSVS